MNWVIINNAYGKPDNDDDLSTFRYDDAVEIAKDINSRIDRTHPKSYREIVCIVGWMWLETSDLVYDPEMLRLNSTQDMDYYEVPMPDYVPYTEYPEDF